MDKSPKSAVKRKVDGQHLQTSRGGRASRGRSSQGIQLPMERFIDVQARKPQHDNDVIAPESAPTDDADQYNISDDEEGGTRIGGIYIPPPIPAYCSAESKGPRLIIKKIINENFKSYANKVALGPFHQRFTAIIGPNGSGKSNVIDSMLFVFGYRAAKIRCKKISTLLHNSAAYPNVNKASVAVHFVQIEDLPDGNYTEVPNSEIIIERTAFRDNSSHYTINGKRAQFKEVSKLLKKHHVDLDHNRFLILQGEVESISMMKPKAQNDNECGMLEYLEDIIGTSRYKEPLLKLNERVEALTVERTEKSNRVKLVERDISDLQGPYNAAIEYLKLENENICTKNLRIQKYLSEKNKKMEKYAKEHEEITNELQKHDEEAAAMKKEREAKEELVRHEQMEFNKLIKEMEDLKLQLETAKKNHVETQLNMTATNKRRKQNKAQLEKHEAELLELRKIPLKNQQEIEECEKKVERLTSQIGTIKEQLEENYKAVEVQTQPLKEQREKFGKNLIEVNSKLNEAKEVLGCTESELAIETQEKTKAVRKLESMKTSQEESQKSLKTKTAELEQINAALPEIKKELSTHTNQLQKLKMEEQQTNEKLKLLKADIRERTETFRSARSNNKVLDFLMRQKHEGKIPGIFDRLGNLGAIDEKYDVAISTACGRLDNILVDTVDTATKCIEALKRHNVGNANFIALEKMDRWRNKMQPVKTPENVPRLFDLIRVEDERIRPAFYFSLFETLVAVNLEQARRIAYGVKRNRVVTLNGEVIEASGTMTGGGSSKNRIHGKMGTQVQTKTGKNLNQSISEETLDDMQRQAQDLQSKVNYCQQEQGRLENEIRVLKIAGLNKEAEMPKLVGIIKNIKQTLLENEKDVTLLSKKIDSIVVDAAKMKQLKALIAEKKQIIEKYEKEAEAVQKQMDECTKKINDIQQEKVKVLQTKITNQNREIKKLEQNIKNLTVQVSTSERDVIKTEKKMDELRASITKDENDIRELSEERTKFSEQSAELADKLQKAEQTISDTKRDASGIEKDIKAIAKKENESNIKRLEIDQKLQTVAAKLAEVKAQIPHWQEQLKPLQLLEIPDEPPPEPLKTYTEEELAGYTLQDLQYTESVQDEKLRTKPNLSVIQDYNEKKNLYIERIQMLEDVSCKRNQMREKFDEVTKRRTHEFFTGYKIINEKLKEMYQMITHGGNAELELSDSMDPFTEGITFSVRPPRKSWKMISNLSGGEKTLASLALVFALHYYKPSPLYFMDEIDAALDFKNVSIVAHYIKERTKNAQFIIISLRSNMFELSDVLVGIYKCFDCTDSLSVKNSDSREILIGNPVAKESNQQTVNRIISQIIHEPSQSIVQTLSQNQENIPPSMPPHRDTTFAPNIESTAYSQFMQISQEATLLPDQEAMEVDDIAEASAAPNNVFKMPLPPSATSSH